MSLYSGLTRTIAGRLPAPMLRRSVAQRLENTYLRTNGSVRRRKSATRRRLTLACLPRVELTSLLEDLRIHLADPGVVVYVLLLWAWP
jgi:hypothetical protein